jgi:hypothetical protein
MRSFIRIVLMTATVLCSFSAYALERFITNKSASTWIITSLECPDDIQFGLGCAPGSAYRGGLCLLEPGQTTTVQYYGSGKLAFTFEGAKQLIVVRYTVRNHFDPGVGMQSSYPEKINDVHGNLTIFKNADSPYQF